MGRAMLELANSGQGGVKRLFVRGLNFVLHPIILKASAPSPSYDNLKGFAVCTWGPSIVFKCTRAPVDEGVVIGQHPGQL